MNIYFVRKDMQIDDMHIKRCYTLLANSEIQVKTTMRYDFHSEE